MRLLVAEGNTAEVRTRVKALTGATPGESYAEVLRAIAPDATVELACPADSDPKLPSALESYDGVAITGSALNIHKGEPESLRQVELTRKLFGLGTPIFGSCWGLQVAAVASGGEVARNPRGREVAFARKIALTEQGLHHALHRGRDAIFDAPAIHGDEVVRLPHDATVTASNGVSAIQAAVIPFGKGTFWGVQYHPEYSFADVAAMLRRYGQLLVDEGFFPDLGTLQSYAADLLSLDGDTSRRDVAWRFGLGDELLRPALRRQEIANWIEHQVRPTLGG